jgi:hypothetical protein
LQRGGAEFEHHECRLGHGWPLVSFEDGRGVSGATAGVGAIAERGFSANARRAAAALR